MRKGARATSGLSSRYASRASGEILGHDTTNMSSRRIYTKPSLLSRRRRTISPPTVRRFTDALNIRRRSGGGRMAVQRGPVAGPEVRSTARYRSGREP